VDALAVALAEVDASAPREDAPTGLGLAVVVRQRAVAGLVRDLAVPDLRRRCVLDRDAGDAHAVTRLGGVAVLLALLRDNGHDLAGLVGIDRVVDLGACLLCHGADLSSGCCFGDQSVMVFVSVPRPSIRVRSTSPGEAKRGGRIPCPTPPGVPVSTTSPGR